MAIDGLLAGKSFSPEAVAAMRRAYEDVINALDISRGQKTMKETVAVLIIQIAAGEKEWDADRLRDNAMAVLAGSKGSNPSRPPVRRAGSQISR